MSVQENSADRGNTAFVSSLWDRYHGEIQSYIKRRVSCPQDAADLVQEVFLRAQEKANQMVDPSRAGAWLFKTTRHLVIDHYRQKERQTREWRFTEDPVDSPDVPGDSYDHEVATCLNAMINEMPDKYQEAIQLTVHKEMSQKQLAKETGLSYSGAKSRVQRGKKVLGEMLKECCEIEWDAYGHAVDMQHRKNNCSFC